MASAPDFLTQLVRAALDRRGNTPAPATGNHAPPAPRDPGPEAAGDLHPGADLDPGIAGILAEKVLLAWLRNRHQLLFPFALDLRRLDRDRAELLVHAMVAAAQADGSFEARERDRIDGVLAAVTPNEGERRALAAALSRPKPLYDLLRDVRDVQTGALVYAASLLAVDGRKPVNRHYLGYLAARLQLSPELVESLEQRFRSSA